MSFFETRHLTKNFGGLTAVNVLSFQVEQGDPVIALHDEGQVIANYHGKDAYQSAMQFIDDSY